MNSRYPLVRDYVLSADYRSLRIKDRPDLEGLELAIVGYVICSSVTTKKGEPKCEHTTSYAMLQELIFEYFKINEPDNIKRSLDKNIRTLQRVHTAYLAPEFVEKVEYRKRFFTELLSREVSKITYEEFEPKSWNIEVLSSLTTPFKKDCNDRINELGTSGILIRLRQKYVSFNPDLKFSWSKK